MNEHYPDEESFVFAIADALHHEYKAITDAGIILQLDDPDLPDGWQMYPEMSVADYRKYADVRVEAINRALDGIPSDRVRLHICWGSGHGPHTNDIPLEDIVDVVLKVKADCYSVGPATCAANTSGGCGRTLTAGRQIAHARRGLTRHRRCEHPQVVADRLVRYAKMSGAERSLESNAGIGSATARSPGLQKLHARRGCPPRQSGVAVG